MIARKQKWKLLLICITLSFAANFHFGFSTTYLNTSVAKFRIYLNESLSIRGIEMDENLYTWIWSAILNVWFVGYIIGLSCSSIIIDRFGRKGWGDLFFKSFKAKLNSFQSVLWSAPYWICLHRYCVPPVLCSSGRKCSLSEGAYAHSQRLYHIRHWFFIYRCHTSCHWISVG